MAYAIKWTRKNHRLMEDKTGYLIKSFEIPRLGSIMTFDTIEEAEENLKEAEELATESMTFEIVPYNE